MKYNLQSWWPISWQRYQLLLKDTGLNTNQLKESYLKEQRLYEQYMMTVMIAKSQSQTQVGNSKINNVSISESEYIDDYVDDYVE